MVKPVSSPISGAKTMNVTVLKIPSHCNGSRNSVASSALDKAAPIMPPIRACDELVGKPQYQVIRSQKEAAIRVAAMTLLSTIRGSMMPVPIVAATLRWNTRKAIKLKNAAQTTATWGVSTRVDTTVAIELAASWQPLRKSNPSASRSSSQTSSESCTKGTLPKFTLSKKCMLTTP